MSQHRPMRAGEAARPTERADAGREASGGYEARPAGAVSRWFGGAARGRANAATPPPRKRRGLSRAAASPTTDHCDDGSAAVSALRRLRRRANALLAGARRRAAGGSTGPALLAGARRRAADGSTGPALLAGARRRGAAAAAGMPTRPGALRRGVRRAAGGVCAAVLFAAVLVVAPQPAAAHTVTGYLYVSRSSTQVAEGAKASFQLCRTDVDWGTAHTDRTWGIFDWEIRYFGTSSDKFATYHDIAPGSRSGTHYQTGTRYCDTVNVQTAGDNIVEPTESFQFKLTKYQHKNHTPDRAGSPTGIAVNIVDDDGNISLHAAEDANQNKLNVVTEGSDLKFDIRMDNSIVPGGHTVTAVITRTTAECEDFTNCSNGTVTVVPIKFAGDANEKRTLTIPTVDDDLVESTDRFSVTVTSSNPNLKTRTATATGTINDNDEATLTLSDVSVTEGYDGEYTISNTGKAVEHPFTVTVTDAEDTSSGAKKALPSDGSRAWSSVDYVDFSHTYTFQGDVNESYTGTFYANVNLDGGSPEQDDETFKLKGQVSGQQGTVNNPTDSTVTIDNSDETNIVLTVGDSWQSEGDGGQGGTSYLVFPIAKNNVRQGPNNGNITVKLNITENVTDHSTDSADYETDTNGDPVFTCWNRYPSTQVDKDFDASTDANTLTTGIDGKTVAAGHHCAIDGDASVDTVFARLKITGDTVREPPNGDAGESFEVSLETATYHGITTPPADGGPPLVVATDKGIGGILNDDLEALRIEFVPGSGGRPPDNNRDPYAIDECSGSGCRNSVRVRAALYSEHGNAGTPVAAVQDIHIDLELERDTNTVARDGDITASTHRLTIRRGQQRSNQATIRAVDNDIDNSTLNEAQFFIVPHVRNAGGGLDAGVFLQGIGLEVIDDDDKGWDVRHGSRCLVGCATGGPVGEFIHLHEGDDQGETYWVRLRSEPTHDVTITPTLRSDPGFHQGFTVELPGGSTSWTVTPQDWDVYRPVTVKAPDDDDGSSSLGDVTHTATSSDSNYSTRFFTQLSEIDDDAGVTATGPSLTWGDSLSLDEGGSSTYSIKLDTKPGVSIGESWYRACDHVRGRVVCPKPRPDGTNNPFLRPADLGTKTRVTVSLDSARNSGAKVTLGSKIDTSNNNAIVPLCDASGDDAIVTSKSLDFTPDNWATAQDVTVWACEDDDDTASGEITLTHTVISNDPAYNKWAAPRAASALRDVRVSVADNDAPVVTLLLRDAATGGNAVTSISENGGVAYVQASLSEALASATTTVRVSAAAAAQAAPGDFSRSGSVLTIAAGQTASTGTVTITGRDNLFDGADDKAVRITATSSSSDAANAPVTGPAAVTLGLDDDETAGVTVSGASGLSSLAESASGTYQVALSSRPHANVVVTPVVPEASAGKVSVSPATLVFTPSDYRKVGGEVQAATKTVTVTALFDEDTADETVTISHTVEDETDDESGYADADAANLGTQSVTVNDTSAGASLSATALAVPEGDTSGVSYSVVLTAAPGSSETVTVTAGLATTPSPDGNLLFLNGSTCSSTATTKALTFTSSDWYRPKDVTVCATADTDNADGTATVTHTVTSSDSNSKYSSGVTVGTVALSEVDTSAGSKRLVLTATPQNSLATERSEVLLAEGASSTDASDTHKVSVKLSTTPTTNVTITAAVTGTGFTVNGGATATQTFRGTGIGNSNSDPWVLNLGSAADDDAAVNAGMLTLTVSVPEDAPADQQAWEAQTQTIDLVQLDSGSVGIEVSDTTGQTAWQQNLMVPEGRYASYRVRLTSRPLSTVRIYPVRSGDPSLRATTYPVYVSPSGWNQWRTVNVYASSDGDALDGTAILSHRLYSSDDHYHALPTPDQDVTLVEADDEFLSVAYSTTELGVPKGGSSSYDVVLTRRPSRDVNVRIHPQTGSNADSIITADSDPDADGDQLTLTFEPNQWSVPQSVTVSATGSAVTGDSASKRTFVHTASSDDSRFAVHDFRSITATAVVPPPQPSQIVTSPSSMRLALSGGASQGFMRVSLNKAPSAEVTVYLTARGDAQVTIQPQQLTFTTANWNKPQIVSVQLAAAAGGGGGGQTQQRRAVVGSSGPPVAEATANTSETTDGGGATPAVQVQMASTSTDSSFNLSGAVPVTEAAQPTAEPDALPASQGTGGGTGGGGGGSAPQASASGSQRHGGPDRYDTAATVAAEYVKVMTQPGSGTDEVTTAIVASGKGFADALAASMLSRSLNAPILLTPPDRLDAAVSGAIKRHGISRVVIVGGTKAVSEAVEAELDALDGVTVTREAGDDRYETAAKAATAAGAAGMLCSTSKVTAIIASGVSWPDAVIAGPLSYRGRHPVLLTERDAVPAATLKYLADNAIAHVLVIGGPAVVSHDVLSQLTAAGVSAARIAGDNRNDTAAVLAHDLMHFTETSDAATAAGTAAGNAPHSACFANTTVGLASGLDFADALTAAPLLGQLGAPLLLTAATVPAETLAYAAGGHLVPKSGTKAVIAIGGSRAVPAAHITELLAKLTP